MSGFIVTNPGMLSLIQDAGRYGQHALGLTTSGPLDEQAYYWANRLLENLEGVPAIEVTLGGLQLRSEANTRIAVTGASMPLMINGQRCDLWRTYQVRSGDQIRLGFAGHGCRSYLAVSGGFIVEPQFGSAATVMREGVGGLGGVQLQRDDRLRCSNTESDGEPDLALAQALHPPVLESLQLRVIPGYQHAYFSRDAKRRFFRGSYQLTQQCDRMGFRLKGPAVASELERIYSEGISLGAVQVPADGQPIILMHDRQTIGGYPKLGNVFSLDLSRLSQCVPGSEVRFTPITVHAARRALREERGRRRKAKLLMIKDRRR